MATIEAEITTDATSVAVDPPAKKESATGGAKSKKAKAKKPSSPRKSSAYPPFYEMVSDAIVTLKEKSGSSQYAIQKFAEEKHKKLPANFRKMLLIQLKRLVASGKLVKVKISFKLPNTKAPALPKKSVAVAVKPKPTAKKAVSKAEEKVKTKPKAKTAAKPKSVAAKVAKTSVVSSPAKKAVAKPKKTKRLSAVKSPAMKKAGAPGKKLVATPKKMKRLTAVKTPAKRMSARKVAK